MKINMLVGSMLVGAVAGPAVAQERGQPGLTLEPYSFTLADGTRLAAERGTYWVPEDRGNRRSRRIAIGFVRFKSTNPQPGAPLVYLAGGPGGSGVATARGPRQSVFLALRAYGDVIALDQRGTGFSNHMKPCRAQRRFSPAVTIGDRSLTAYYRETLTKCVVEWRAAGVAIEGYTTSQSADDIEDLRRHLGVPKVNLWGISYGSQLALETMRRHPRSIRRVVLASVDGTDQNIKRPAAVDAVFERIERAMPNAGLRETMRSVHAALDARPLPLQAKGADGHPVSFTIDSFPVRMLAGILPKNPDGIPMLTGAYKALAAGQGAAIAPQVHDFFLKEPLAMTGMPELIDIASGLSPAKIAMVQGEVPASLLGDAINFPVSRLIGMVPELAPRPPYWQLIHSQIPVLVLSGDLDPRTPLEEQAEAIAGLSNRHQIIVRNGGHDLFEAHPEIPGLMIDFFSGRPVKTTELTLPRPISPGSER